MNFGVTFLDDAFGGIMKHDLVLIGAKTGAGKTELVNIIAENAVRKGKSVYYMALEAEPHEVTMRLLYRQYAEKYFSDTTASATRKFVTYSAWRQNELVDTFKKYKEEVENDIRSNFMAGHAAYKVVRVDMDNVYAHFVEAQNKADLFILDHIHYIDHDDDNENKAIHDITKRINQMVYELGKPVILVAHLRKTDRKSPSLLPDIEDFHGSSNLGKICTKAVILGSGGPVIASGHVMPGQFYTYMRVVKNRLNMSVTKYVARATFSIKKNAYQSNYEIGWYSDTDKEFKETADIPEWAKHATSNKEPVQQKHYLD